MAAEAQIAANIVNAQHSEEAFQAYDALATAFRIEHHPTGSPAEALAEDPAQNPKMQNEAKPATNALAPATQAAHTRTAVCKTKPILPALMLRAILQLGSL